MSRFLLLLRVPLFTPIVLARCDLNTQNDSREFDLALVCLANMSTSNKGEPRAAYTQTGCEPHCSDGSPDQLDLCWLLQVSRAPPNRCAEACIWIAKASNCSSRVATLFFSWRTYPSYSLRCEVTMSRSTRWSLTVALVEPS